MPLPANSSYLPLKNTFKQLESTKDTQQIAEEIAEEDDELEEYYDDDFE